jgi:hypothetical protein
MWIWTNPLFPLAYEKAEQINCGFCSTQPLEKVGPNLL